MNYDEALQYIHGARTLGRKRGLQNISMLLELMGNPHSDLKYVHVAGTNGKGSTVAFISRVLMEAGYRVGIFVSPYIERFTERIRINEDEISHEELIRLTSYVKGMVEKMLENGECHPTEFEIVTAIAFQYFHESKCDVVVLEAGLGGRTDSTNVIGTSLVSVITSISYDHMSILGDTLAEIASEKAGIIRNYGDVVLYPQTEEVDRVFEKECNERSARLHRVDFSGMRLEISDMDGQNFDINGYRSLHISLLGLHQPKNAATALTALDLLRHKGFDISDESIRKGLKNAKWPGRMEVLSREPIFIIDGAHNPEGVQVLARTLEKYFPKKRKIFIFGVMRDKDIKSMIEAIAPIAYKFITVTPYEGRAMKAEELALFIKSYCKNVEANDTIEGAIGAGLSSAAPGDVICAFGSLYYIGEIRRIMKNSQK